MLGQFSVAAASAPLGVDLAANQPWQVSQRARKWIGYAMAGSAAALDTHVRLMVGTTQVGDAYNTATGAPTRDHLFRLGAYIPPGEPIHVYVDDAPATNPINGLVDLQE